MPKGRRFSYNMNDVEDLKENIPNLRYVSPRNRLGGWRGSNNVIRGLNVGAFNVYGDYPEIINQDPMQITSGRFMEDVENCFTSP